MEPVGIERATSCSQSRRSPESAKTSDRRTQARNPLANGRRELNPPTVTTCWTWAATFWVGLVPFEATPDDEAEVREMLAQYSDVELDREMEATPLVFPWKNTTCSGLSCVKG